MNHSEQNKTLLEYIDLRIRLLQYAKRTESIKRIPEDRREIFRRQIRGRTLELVSIRSVICRHQEEDLIAKMTKRNFPPTGKKGLRYIRKENKEDVVLHP